MVFEWLSGRSSGLRPLADRRWGGAESLGGGPKEDPGVQQEATQHSCLQVTGRRFSGLKCLQACLFIFNELTIYYIYYITNFVIYKYCV